MSTSAYNDAKLDKQWEKLSSGQKVIDILTGAFPKLSTAIKDALAASSAAGGGFSGLAAGAKAMASSLGLATTAFSVFAAVAAAAVIGVSAYRAHMESIRQSAVEGANAFSSAQSSLEEYTNKVKELRTALAEGTLTDSEAYAAKKELYEIQNSLVDTYGKQAAGIDLVNGSLEEQIQSLEKLSLLESQRLLNEKKAGIDVAIREMTKTLGGDAGWFTTGGEYMGQYYNNGSDASNRLNSILSKYTNIKQYDGGEDGLVTIRFVGDATEAKETLNNLMTDLREADRAFGKDTFIFDDIFDYASSIYNEADKIIEKYQDIYEQGMKAKLIEESVGNNPKMYGEDGNSKTAAEWISSYTDAVKEYNDALASGDTGKISAARSEFEELNGTITGLLSDKDGMGQYAFMFNEISDALNQSAISAQTFKESIERFPQESERLKAAGMTDTQFASAFIDGLGSDATSRAIKSILEQYANAFGLEFGNLTISQVESVAGVLTNMGILQKDTSAQKQSEIKPASERLSALWNSEGFADSKTKLKELAQTADGISADKILELASSNKELDSILHETGMSARFLAEILQNEALHSGDGFQLMTDEALKLNAALNESAKYFDEVTAARSRYESASSVPEVDDNFKSMANAYKTLQEQTDAGKQGNAFWAAAEYIFGDSQLEKWDYSIERIKEAMSDAGDIFSNADSAGAGFLDKLYSIAEGGQIKSEDGSLLAEIQKLSDGSYKFNVDLTNLDALSEKMGVSREAILASMEALSMWGDVSYYDIDNVLGVMKEVGLATDKFDGTAINVANLNSQLNALGYHGKDLHDIKEAISGIAGVTLIDINGDINTLVEGLTNLGIATSETGDIQINADAFGSLIENLSISKADADALVDSLKNIGASFVDADGNTVEVNFNEDDLNPTVTFHRDSSEVDSYNPPNYSRTVTYHLSYVGGTIPGFATGTKGAPGGPALVGEEEEELVRSGDKAYFVGTNGPEIVNLNPGDEVYTAEQTKKIKSGTTRLTGVIPAYAAGTFDELTKANSGSATWRCVCGGTAYVGKTCPKCGRTQSQSNAADGTVAGQIARDNANSAKTVSSNVSGAVKPVYHIPTGSGGGGGGSSGGGYQDESEQEEQYEKINWIEVQISRIERSIDKLKNVASSAFKALSTRLSKTRDQISEITKEISIQQQAEQRYLREADSIGISGELKALVRSGAIDIREYDSETAKLINEYKEWYEKSLDAANAVDTLHDSLASLYQDSFNNIKTDFENQISFIDHQMNSYQTALDTMELIGLESSEKLYRMMEISTKRNISLMTDEVSRLDASLKEALASGEISEYSEAWYEMKNAIFDVREQINEANNSLIEYSNTIRKIQWERFDYLRNSISNINSEMEFMTQLLGYSDLFDNDGKITDAGKATAGLLAAQYNVYMNQADSFRDAVMAINKDIANDPNNRTLLDRRNELLIKQREAIIAAEQEKVAIRDLVSSGIESELQAMKKLIDEYNNTADSAKSLYDYQKKIKTSSNDVARIQKLISAYQAGDDSEESRSRIQKLTLDLQNAQDALDEQQYSQYINDQKKLLDDLYSEYEEILNSRIDDIDSLVSQTIDAVNDSAVSISDTIREASKDVGYIMTDNMTNIFGGSGIGAIVTAYGDDFSSKITAINSVLRGIEYGVIAMAEHSDSIAEGSVRAYKKGGLADFTGLAKLDGTPSDPEIVLNSQDSKNLIALRNILRGATDIQSLIAGSSKSVVGSYVSDISDVRRIMNAVGSSVDRAEIHDINITIPIDRVNDYNDFVRQLRDDGQFERFIQDVTLGQISKRNPLSKKKYTW